MNQGLSIMIILEPTSTKGWVVLLYLGHPICNKVQIVYRLDRRELLILLHANCEVLYTVMLTDCGVPVHEICRANDSLVFPFL